tara:strand:+ start:181094 stop:182173 length:1080 start_codon:yes stop_codon:yes gene_type:complete
MKSKTVVLVGSGHAHLEILKALTFKEIVDHRFILISPSRQTYYSGLIPCLIKGEIEERGLTINSADFAESKGFKFIQDEVQSVDQTNKALTLKSGDKIDFDLLSINVGGTPTLIPSDAPFKTVYLRPFDEFMPKWREVQRICSACVNPRFVVVGGGAAAVEVAASLRIRLNKNQAKNSEVHIVSKGARLCENYSEKISEQIKQSLLKRGIKIHLNEPVSQIHQKTIMLRQSGDLQFDSIFIVTPTQPSEIFSGKMDSKLRLSRCIFAAGDGTEMADYPNLPRSGVIAVHQGRHLVKNIRNSLLDLELFDFKFRVKHLNILITGENSALLVWGNFSLEGKWPLRLKNWIDQRYISSFEKN